ncbi:leucine-rich repeat and calponin homology domain-containing protein-like isoform X2 [Ischnura elegans]|uniref:leucine-rich repeat and calponin homology domain-containing protein-like isoform X2 n=1 Tax=Ischnura elegans TaxID=197161 RepID=UPI001ED87CF8|nr:leucine-rich repeat and calponin homology domain-containing protein-like isoform X2 [Ischnura elegans]
MATNVVNTGGHLQAQLTRSLERILEDASLSGELKLSGRKLKEFPKTGGKYNLNDTVVADLSKNRFSELPRDVTEFSSLERLDLYHNAIRSLPQSVVQLQTLTYLDLSRNQLTHLPGGLCSLPLKVLRVANNKLSALPMDLPRLGPTLTELDADCNEIASLPPHMGQLISLRSLRLRRNLLSYLPVEITSLRLVRLDVSENRISVLPVEMRKMTTLVSLDLGDNPLVTPPACLCTRGRVHIFKYLEIQAMKDDKRKGVVTLTPSEEAKIRRPSRKGGILSDLRLTNGLGAPYNVPEDSLGWQKRFTVDSGYGSTGDGIDVKSWAQNPRLGTLSQDAGLTMTVKSKGDQTPPTKPGSLPVSNGGGSAGTCFSGTSTPSTISPGESYMDLEEELIKVRQLEALSEESAVDGRRRKGSGGSGFPSQEQGVGKRTLGHVRFNSNGSNGVNGGSPEHLKSGQSPSSGANSENVDPLRGTQEDVRKPLEHIQTYREYKEALRQQRAGQDGASIYRTRGGISSVDGPQTPGSPVNSSSANDVFASRVSETQPADDEGLTMTVSSESSSPLRKRGSPSENQNPLSQSPSSYQAKVRNKSSTGSAVNNGNGSIISSQPHMVNGGRGVTNHSSPQHKPAANGAATSPPPYTPPPPLSPPTTSLGAAERISSTGGSNSSPRLVTTSVGYVGGSQGVPGRATLQWPPPPQPPSPTDAPAANITTDPVAMRCRGGRVASVKQQLLWNRDASPHKLTFTMRREFEKAKEEAELIEKMRNSIEVRLKMTLPEDLSPALSDGVVLCHLANHVRPRSVSSIYVPSPAVPKLTMARCRRNVDNFLEACRKIGVEEGMVCCASDIVEGRGLVRVAITVAELLRFHPSRPLPPSGIQASSSPVPSTMGNPS